MIVILWISLKEIIKEKKKIKEYEQIKNFEV